MAECKAITKSTKQPCRAQAGAGSKWCFVHNPKVSKQRAQARKLGGSNTRTQHAGDASKIPKEINTVKDARSILAYALAEVLPMDNSIARGRLLLALHDSYVKSFEIGEIENRLALLEGKQ